MMIEAGVRLGPYQIVEQIGEGGMGQVFRATDTRLDRDVAIKILPRNLALDAQFLQRFDREAKTISSLNHPNICVLHDIGEQDGHRFLVMELIEGESLADRLRRGPLPIAEAVCYGAQIAEALHRAHRQGIVHRDLKPGNVMITKSGAKLLDFGLAKSDPLLLVRGSSSTGLMASAPTEHKPLTQEGAILGTFQYMAPEQLEGIEADARTDVFALGALLYEMATGRRAFEGKSKASLIAAILDHQPPPVSELQPVAPPAYDHVIRRCLEKDPEDRWQSAHDVASELRWISETGSSAGVAAPVTMRRKSRERIAWALAAVSIVLLAALFWTQFRPREPATAVMSHLLAPRGDLFDFTGVNIVGFAVSPDGKKIAYCAPDESGERFLYIRFLDILEPRKLNGTAGATSPFWSPDSRFIAFFAGGKLKKVDINGAPPLTIADAPRGRPGAWNAEGVILFSPSSTDPIYRVGANGGEAVAVTTLDRSRGETTHRWAHFLPDGRHFLYLAGSHGLPAENEANAIWVGSLDSPEERKFLMHGRSNAFYADGYLVTERGTTLVAQPFDVDELRVTGESVPIAEGVTYDSNYFGGSFSVSPAGVLVYAPGSGDATVQLTWFDRSGTVLGTVGGYNHAGTPSLAPNDRSVAMVIDDSGSGVRDIWLVDLERDLQSRFTFENGPEAGPTWSPDGSMIAYRAEGTEPGGLHSRIKLKSTGGSGDPEILCETSGYAVPQDWSPDGKTIVIGMRTAEGLDIRRIEPAGDRTLEDVLVRDIDDGRGFFSPDGRWLAYVSTESGEHQIFVTSFPERRGKWQISRGGLGPGGAYWRGNEILYLTTDASIMSAHVIEQDGKLIVSNPVALFHNPRIKSFDVTRDGQRFIVNLAPERNNAVPLTLVTDWTSLLHTN